MFNVRGRREMHAKLWWEKLKEGVCLDVTVLVGRIILKWILKETGWRSTDWLHLAEDKGKWRTPVTLKSTFRFHRN